MLSLLVCPLNGTEKMSFCKVMQAQSKATKPTWSTDCGGRVGHVRFQDTNKRPSEGQELNVLVANAVKCVINKKHAKSTAAHDSSLEEDLENFSF